MTAVLLHGCHLQADDWENIMWGTPPQKGRIPKAVELYLKLNATMMVVGSGASRDPESGDLECHVIWDEIANKRKLSMYFSEEEGEDLSDLIFIHGGPDSEAQNTREELVNMRRTIEDYNRIHLVVDQIKTLVLVSSPTHIPRCLRDACAVFGDSKLAQILAVPSDTCFASSSPDDVTIFEPPHRGDVPREEWYNLTRRIFDIPLSDREEFAREFENLLERYHV